MAHPGFIVEFNNPTAYGKQFRSHMRVLGIKGKRLKHKTAWLLNYDGSFTKYKRLKRAIALAIKRNGSALIVSLRTRKAWILKRKRFGYKVKLVAKA
jgi:hypothetical protein